MVTKKSDYRLGLSFGKCCGYAENRIISEIISNEGFVEKFESRLADNIYVFVTLLFSINVIIVRIPVHHVFVAFA